MDSEISCENFPENSKGKPENRSKNSENFENQKCLELREKHFCIKIFRKIASRKIARKIRKISKTKNVPNCEKMISALKFSRKSHGKVGKSLGKVGKFQNQKCVELRENHFCIKIFRKIARESRKIGWKSQKIRKISKIKNVPNHEKMISALKFS